METTSFSPLPVSQYSLTGQLLSSTSPATRRMRHALVADQSSVPGLPALTYQCLAQPGKQIRLLSRHHLGGWTLTNWEAANAPPYTALSYTWGIPNFTRTVIINQSVLKITENCWFALLQLDRMRESKYFWIDAICINQTDLEEKGPHVRVIGDVFARAEWTYVSLGPCQREISIIPDAIQQQKDWISEGGENYSDWWMRGLDAEAFGKLLAAVGALEEKSWWTRLWTFQEGWKSTNLIFICGAVIFCGEGLCGVLDDWNSCYHEGEHAGTMGSEEEECLHDHEGVFEALEKIQWSQMTFLIREDAMGPDRRDLSSLLDEVMHKDCSDPRDRIFGILSLVIWPNDLPAMTVDYRSSLWSVARAALDYYSYEQEAIRLALNLSSALRLNESAAFLHFRQQSSDRYERGVQSLEEGNTAEPDYNAVNHAYTTEQNGMPRRVCFLEEQSDSQLTADLSGTHFSDSSKLAPDAKRISTAELDQLGAKPVVFEGEVFGYVSSCARPGDVLAELDFHNGRLCFILRSAGDRLFQMVGLATFWGSTRVREYYDSRSMPDNGLGPLKFYFDSEDLLILGCIHQDKKVVRAYERESLLKLALSPTKSAFSSFAIAVPGK